MRTRRDRAGNRWSSSARTRGQAAADRGLSPARTAAGAIKDAVATARTMLGKPYNTSYVLNEDSYYCSDFIERAFRAHHVFALQPMNFRNPQTGQIAQHWVDLYRGMGMDVPQDQPGTNPNDMSAAPVLQRVGVLE
jgi:hypothetical protein